MQSSLSRCRVSVGHLCRAHATALIVAAAFAMTILALSTGNDNFSDLDMGNVTYDAMLQSAVQSF
jgi:hypothetical protein